MKTRKQTIVISLIILAVYNVIIWLIPSIKNTTFWVAYGFSNLAIIVASLATLSALDDVTIKGKFQGMPLIYISRAYLVVQIIMGLIEIYSPLASRTSILINVIILAIGTISLVMVNSGKKEIERVEKKVQEKVFFIKELQAEVETYCDQIKDPKIKKEVNSIAETIRYSDPMTHSKLAMIENQINTKIEILKQTPVEEGEKIKEIGNEIQQLLAERNRKAKLYKDQPEQNVEPQKPLNFKMIIAFIVVILVIIVVAITTYYTVIVPKKQYEEAMKLYTEKKYQEAKEAFEKLGDYEDSQDKQKEVMYQYAMELLEKQDYENAEKEFEDLEDYKDSQDKKKETIYKKAEQIYENKNYSEAAEQFLKLGDYKDAKDKVIEIYNLFGEKDVLYFGQYKEEPIAWQILDIREHKVLLITQEPIDEMAYNKEYTSVEWKDSTIRKWLNEDFYRNFNEKEKARILKNTAEEDNVFLLSSKNIKSYSKLKNASTSWWIESDGAENTKAMYVEKDGTINTNGDVVTKLHGVRPSIWLNLD